MDPANRYNRGTIDLPLIESSDDEDNINIDGSQPSPKTIFSDKDENDFLSDEHIEKLKTNKIATDVLKECRTRMRRKDDENRRLRAEKDALLRAMAAQTGVQAAQNHGLNARNRIDYQAVNQGNISSTVMRIGSLVLSVAMAILAVVFIVL